MSVVRQFLGERRKRMISTLMRYVEKEVYPLLDQRQREALREKILQVANEYHDGVADIVTAATDDSSLVNQEALNLIARVGTQLQAWRSERRDDS